jgi:hypothetical protein
MTTRSGLSINQQNSHADYWSARRQARNDRNIGAKYNGFNPRDG